MDDGTVIELSAHRRASRWAQMERPALSIPARLQGSRYGVNSPFVPSWVVATEASSAA